LPRLRLLVVGGRPVLRPLWCPVAERAWACARAPPGRVAGPGRDRGGL